MDKSLVSSTGGPGSTPGPAIFYDEPNARLYCGHALEILKQMASDSVDCVITSPPYWGLRTYKTEPIIWGDNHCGHEWGIEKIVACGRNDNAEKGGALFHGTSNKTYAGDSKASQGNFCLKCNAWRGELGLEPTIELYIEHLVLIFNEVKRVLKKTGTCFVNLDDSYAGGKGQSGCGDAGYQENRTDATLNKPYHQMGGRGLTRPADGNIGIPAKSLCLIPQRFAIAMVENGWILRNDICWNKPNPMPESVKDRFTGSWEHLFFFVKNKKYWFEQQFEGLSNPLRSNYQSGARTFGENRDRNDNDLGERSKDFVFTNRNKRDVWEITTQPYPEAHFAVYPEKLCETPILAGCPSMICEKCGKAREKIYTKGFTDHGGDTATNYEQGSAANRLALLRQTARGQGSEYTNQADCIGYSDCGCNEGFEAGVVMDIFAGSGTTGAVSKRLGRKYIGIELNRDYCKLHKKRLQAISLPMELNG